VKNKTSVRLPAPTRLSLFCSVPLLLASHSITPRAPLAPSPNLSRHSS
jgi:hypothetical protein